MNETPNPYQAPKTEASAPRGIDTVDTKVLAIFTELAGSLATRLNGSVIAEPAMSAIAAALAPEYGSEKAAEIAFHMTDWNSNAAFVVAAHLFPERFTPEEIAAGVRLFLTHAPNHIRAACGLTGEYVWADFPDDSEAGPPEAGNEYGQGGT